MVAVHLFANCIILGTHFYLYKHRQQGENMQCQQIGKLFDLVCMKPDEAFVIPILTSPTTILTEKKSQLQNKSSVKEGLVFSCSAVSLVAALW